MNDLDPSLYSQRLISRQLAPEFLWQPLLTKKFAAFVHSFEITQLWENNRPITWRGVCDESGNLLHLWHQGIETWGCQESKVVMALVDVAAQMAMNKNRKALHALFAHGYREVESYLRDQNHIPSIPQESWPATRQKDLVATMATTIVAGMGLAMSKFQAGIRPSISSGKKQKMTLPELALQVMELIESVIAPSLANDQGAVELVCVEDLDGIYLKAHGACASCPHLKSGTQLFIQLLLRQALGRELQINWI